jgi:hypothetical protein
MIGIGRYRGRVTMSITSCKVLVADPWLIAEALGDELDQLTKAVAAAAT